MGPILNTSTEGGCTHDTVRNQYSAISICVSFSAFLKISLVSQPVAVQS